MAGLASRSFAATDDVRTFANGRMEVVDVGGAMVGRATFAPGWKWSECVRPVAGTDSCQVAHLGYVVSGRMRVVMDDGTAGDAAAGDAFRIAPGHDAWIVGDEPCVIVDFQGAAGYGRT